MANKDLRDWIAGIEAAGELKTIKGAEPKEEIGGIVDIYMRKMGNPAVHVRRGARFSKRPSRHRQHSHLGAAHQHRARSAAGVVRDGADPVVAQLYEERAVASDQGG